MIKPLVAGLMVMLLTIPACTSQYHSNPSSPKVKLGVLDLRNWEFETMGQVRLDGEWEFHWKKLHAEIAADAKKAYIGVPGRWSASRISGKDLGPHGYGTYRLTILLPLSSSGLQ